jgi:drug/metabolite transporter (DMT)-like permease
LEHGVAANESIDAFRKWHPSPTISSGSKMENRLDARSAHFIRVATAWLTLLVMGASWGLSFSLARIASSSGAHPLGITFWEATIAAVLLILTLLTRRESISLTPMLLWFCLLTGLVGMVIPATLFFYAAAHVPAGVLSLSLAVVPIMTFIASVLLRIDRFAFGRMIGVLLGVMAIMLLVIPSDSLPDPAQLSWVFVALLASSCYAVFNILFAIFAPKGGSLLLLTFGMFIAASLAIAPVLLATGNFVGFSWPWGTLEWSLLALGLINAVAFTLYFALIETAGPVFTSLTTNAVTLFGVIWGIMIFDEKNSIWVWLSLLTMMAALLLVAPRRSGPRFITGPRGD